MEQIILGPFGAGLAAAAVTSLGVMIIRFRERWAVENAIYFCAFAAGVLISVSFLHIIPKAIALDGHAPAFLLAGFFAMHLLNRFLKVFLCDDPVRENFAIGIIPLVGIALHSLLDGVIYAVTFQISTVTGILAAIGMILHEFPEGVFTYVLLLKGGVTKKQAAWLAILGAGLTTPLGVIIAYPIISWLQPASLAALLALSAGALVYVGATHLLPMTERADERHSLVAFATGMVVALGIVSLH